MNVFQNFNDLWHNDNSFNNLFQNLWDFNDLLYGCVYWDFSLLKSINNLNLVLNEVLGVDNFFDFRDFNDLFSDNFNFSILSIVRVNLNNFFNFNLNFLNNFLSNSDFNNLFNIFLNNFMDFNELRNNGFKFNDLMSFNHLFNDLFNFDNSWDFNN